MRIQSYLYKLNDVTDLTDIIDLIFREMSSIYKAKYKNM